MSDADAAKLFEPIFREAAAWEKWIAEFKVPEIELKGKRAHIPVDALFAAVTALRSLTREAELRKVVIEECARIAENFDHRTVWSDDPDMNACGYVGAGTTCDDIAAAIRALSSEGQEKKSQSSDGGGKLAPANRRVGSETISPVAGDTKHQGSRIAGVAPGPSEALALNEGERKPKFDNVSCSNCGRSFGPGDHGYSHCEQHTHCEVCGGMGGKHHADFDGFVCDFCQSLWQEPALRSPPVSEPMTVDKLAYFIGQQSGAYHASLAILEHYRLTPLPAAPDTEGR